MIPKPLNDLVIVDPDTAPDESEGGILIPDVAKQRSDTGTVMAVGPGRLANHPFPTPGQPPHMSQADFEKVRKVAMEARLPMTVKPGDKVLFAMYAGHEIKVNGKDVKVMHEDDILGVMGE